MPHLLDALACRDGYDASVRSLARKRMEHFMPTQDSPSSSSPCRTRVLIVDDMLQVRQELRLLLSLIDDLEIVGEAANGAEAIEQVEALRPDAVVIDLEMPVMDGYAAARQIKTRWPACRVIALTVHAGDMERHTAAQSGVDAFIVKGAPIRSLIQAMTEEKE
jgi:DNA-binding NarL/FixJ family response regulator